MNKLNWIQRPFFSYHKSYLADGSVRRSANLFGVWLWGIPDISEHELRSSVLILSLFHLVIVDKMERCWEVKLLKHLLGDRVTEQSAYLENTETFLLNGHVYTTVPIYQWEAYSNFKRWLKIRGTGRWVYSVTSPTDQRLPSITSSNPKWGDRMPSRVEMVEWAHGCFDALKGWS